MPIPKSSKRYNPNPVDLTFSQLQAEWYERLAQEGFADIEDTTQPNRPLLSWSGLCCGHMTESDRVVLPGWPESPFILREELLYHPEFSDICESICKHGSNSLLPHQIRSILEMQINGMSCRQIGEALSANYSSIFRAQKKLLEWATLVESRDENG